MPMPRAAPTMIAFLPCSPRSIAQSQLRIKQSRMTVF
jgi:hypothetical protein